MLALLAAAVVYFRHQIVDLVWHHYAENSERSLAAEGRVKPLLQAELGALGLRLGDPVFLRLFKESGELEVWVKVSDQDIYEHYKTYPVCHWPGKLGPKERGGDHQIPEGFYYVARRGMNPNSPYHLSFDLGYPNQYDREHKRGGGRVAIHGGCNSDDGVSMQDGPIEELYTLCEAALGKGMPYFRVHCFPFRMTDQRMNQELAAKAKWIDFWANLKEGYDYFEIVGKPPNTKLVDGKYYFE